MTSSPHFTNICTLPLPSDLFCATLHPTKPLLAVGIATGHVHTFRLPSTDQEQEESNISQTPPQTHLNGTGTSAPSILSTRRRSSTASENGLGNIETLWRTRRHKGSCRTIAYSNDGKHCYSAGTDGLVKVFDSETGAVVAKIAVPVPVSATQSKSARANINTVDQIDAPTAIHELTPMHLVVATDSGAVYIYDVQSKSNENQKEEKEKEYTQKAHNKRQKNNSVAGQQQQQLQKSETVSLGSGVSEYGIAARPSRIEHPHRDEHANALLPLPPSGTSTSGFPKQFVSVGGSTVAVTELRKTGVLAVSDDQEIELSSCCIVSGLKKGGTSVGEKVLVGQGDGVLSLWERGVWGDLDERIVVDRTGASVDALCEVPREFLPKEGRGRLKMNEKVVACGLDDGRIRFVRVGRNGVLPEWDLKHDDVEGVASLLFDRRGNRLVSGGGQTVKIWTKAQIAEGALVGRKNGEENGKADGEEWESTEGDSDDGEEDDEEEGAVQYGDSSDEEDEEEEAESDEDVNRGKRKKRKRNKGKADSAGKALNLSGVF